MVLEGRAGEDELPTGAHLLQLLQYPRVTILEAVALVHDEVCPADAAQRCRLRDHHLKRREHHVELVTIPTPARLAARRARHTRRRAVARARRRAAGRRAAGRPATRAARGLARLRSLPIVLQDHLTSLGVAVVRDHVPMKGRHAHVRGTRTSEALGGKQRHSAVLSRARTCRSNRESCFQRQSEAVRGTQRHSEALRDTQRQSRTCRSTRRARVPNGAESRAAPRSERGLARLRADAETGGGRATAQSSPTPSRRPR